MCEWLSCPEWFDVQLFCGGRTFNAHRAVLASVSTFLRRILLSCTREDAPVLIVLPEFDIEAMSLVLYYIYNGEVVLQKHKYEMFLDIIRAMQISIDAKYLIEIDDLERSEDKQMESIGHSREGFAENQPNICMNLMKDHRVQRRITLQKYSVSETNLYKNHVFCQDLSKQQESCLENLQLPFMDRQRNSFLRDLFIETHPGNGYVNGRAGGVLAISSECYREPRSVLSVNANGHLQAGGPLSRTKIQHLSQDLSDNTKLLNNDITHSRRLNDDLSQMFLPGIDYNLTHVDYITTSRNIKLSQFCQATSSASTLDETNAFNLKAEIQKSRSRRAVLNRVLESPWCARQPHSYKPLRKYKKDKGSLPLNIDTKITEPETSHDGNNNVSQESQLSFLSSSSHAISNNIHKCNICDQVFSNYETLAVHTKRHSPLGLRYTCNECSKSFSQLRNFKYHMSIHRGTREFAATCPVCGKYFNDRGYLSSHMKIHRNRKEYKCSMCPKSFNQRVAYNMHMRIHTGVKPHACEECGKAFSRKMLLKQHQRTHSGERPYACPHCGKRFADRSNMTLHLRLHSGIKPFSCTLCPKSFTKKHHLKSHLNFHTGIKPYSCPRCKLAFTQSSNMRTHLKKCSGPKLPEIDN